jgi:hypothetical protein
MLRDLSQGDLGLDSHVISSSTVVDLNVGTTLESHMRRTPHAFTSGRATLAS